MIKQRILEGRFDDVQRRLNIEAMPFLPSRMLELSDQKSGKSLAEIYEDQYEDQKATENGQVQTPEQDRKLEEEHREIDELFDDINNKLDALTNAHFTPRAPKASIQTLSNAPAITMESSLPATSSGRSMLAPEEVYDAGRHNVSLTGDRSEMTPGEKQRMQRKLRADKAARNSRIEDARRKIEINRAAVGAGPGGPKGRKAEEREKEEALKRLMGNKGVSVVGKGNEDKRAKGKGKAGAPPVNAASLRL
ncbi:hypothetical protein L7F22_058833 [Adiantum nelumboides]|nr:hypothetical protein [Adiantum nelumboides]